MLPHEAAVPEEVPYALGVRARETARRPLNPRVGRMIVDTDLGIPIWYINGNWVDATGATV